jgi:hypothetical protein
MLERILKLYVMYMMTDARSPMPHFVGPPGCGKSTIFQEAADLLGVNLHVINVSRLSPLEVEGVQMPVTMDTKDMHLEMLTATYWTKLKAKDILLFDEFTRGFAEVFNGLLDIFTSRNVAGFPLPQVFIAGASNNSITYDKALEDRLLHIPVDDPRKKKTVRKDMARRLVNTLGLMPDMIDSSEMEELIRIEVLPMFDMLDQLNSKSATSPATLKGTSLRNLIGQVQLREVTSIHLKEVLDMNNVRARTSQKWQYMVLLNGTLADPAIKDKLVKYNTDEKINEKLTPVQRLNIQQNLQLIGMEEARKEGMTHDTDDVDIEDIFS